MYIRGCQGCNFVLQSGSQFSEFKVASFRTSTLGYQRPFWKLPRLSCKNDMAMRKVVTDRMFGSAELLLCGLAKMTDLFSAEHRTFFFVLYSIPMATFHIFVVLN